MIRLILLAKVNLLDLLKKVYIGGSQYAQGLTQDDSSDGRINWKKRDWVYNKYTPEFKAKVRRSYTH